MKKLLLLSGGLDSAAVAIMERPAEALFIDYGQKPAQGERAAALQIARTLDLPFSELTVDCSGIGSGLLAGQDPSMLAPTDEWWPFRNQLLVTLAAGWSIDRGFRTILLGTVASDGARHTDGSTDFVASLDKLVAMQEGSIRVHAPAIEMSSVDLVVNSRITKSIIGWTHSCHRQKLACGACPGCVKRLQVLEATGYQ